MSAHTPGPWHVDSGANGGEVVLARGGLTTVAIVQPDDITVAENLANARLIAAAPELLEALREMVERFESADDTPAYVERAHAAIDKASGRQQ